MPPSQEIHLYEQERLAMQTTAEHAAVDGFPASYHLAQAGQDWYCGGHRVACACIHMEAQDSEGAWAEPLWAWTGSMTWQQMSCGNSKKRQTNLRQVKAAIEKGPQGELARLS